MRSVVMPVLCLHYVSCLSVSTLLLLLEETFLLPPFVSFVMQLSHSPEPRSRVGTARTLENNKTFFFFWICRKSIQTLRQILSELTGIPETTQNKESTSALKFPSTKIILIWYVTKTKMTIYWQMHMRLRHVQTKKIQLLKIYTYNTTATLACFVLSYPILTQHKLT
jgi:hypothetical protein